MKKFSFVLIIILVATYIFAKSLHKESKYNFDLPFYVSNDFTPYWFDEKNIELEKIHTIEEFEFINQDGENFKSTDYNNKIYVVNFFFTTCAGICPNLTTNMSLLYDEFKDEDDFALLSFSVMPDVDNVKELEIFAEAYGIKSEKWNLLTGEKKAIYKTARESFFADRKLESTKTENDFLHSEYFLLIDRNQQIRGVYNGTQILEIEKNN